MRRVLLDLSLLPSPALQTATMVPAAQLAMNESDTPLLSMLRGLELALITPPVRSDAARLDALLHENFLEFGRSGAVYAKADILSRLPAQAQQLLMVADQFEVRPLGKTAALLTYRSADQRPDGTMDRFTLRASVWERTARGWQMRFHQGTPTPPF